MATSKKVLTDFECMECQTKKKVVEGSLFPSCDLCGVVMTWEGEEGGK